MVVLLHFAAVPLIGEYAVFGFFSLSGFLMTLIMQRNYGYAPKGIAAYALNRFLRIYPVWWTACLVSIGILIVLGPAKTTAINPNFALPDTLQSWFQNLAIVLKFQSSPALIAPGWTLTVELFYYALIGLGLSRNRTLTALWFAASVLYTGYLLLGQPTSWDVRYHSIGAASLPFSAGALIWHWHEEIQARFGKLLQWPLVPWLGFAAIIANWAAGNLLNTARDISFYINFLLCAAMIPVLYPRRGLPFVSRKLDDWLGSLSYPLYVLHVPMAYLLLEVFRRAGWPLYGPTLGFFAASLPVLVWPPEAA